MQNSYMDVGTVICNIDMILPCTISSHEEEGRWSTLSAFPRLAVRVILSRHCAILWGYPYHYSSDTKWCISRPGKNLPEPLNSFTAKIP